MSPFLGGSVLGGLFQAGGFGPRGSVPGGLGPPGGFSPIPGWEQASSLFVRGS